MALGSGLVGATVAATAALGGLAGAFGLVAAPVSLLLGNLKDYDDSLDAVKSAEDSARTAAQSRTAVLKTLSDAQANVASTARESKEAIEEQQAVLNRTRAEATAAINAQERVVAEARRTGTAAVAEEEQRLADVRVEGARAIAEQERTLEQTRVSANDANAQAEETLQGAREQLASSTRALSSAQDELNRALQEEPLNQQQATLDLASARDRASDSLRAYNEAVAEFGTNSEEASDARRELAQANLDLQQTEIDVRDVQQNGSEQLRSATEAARSAAQERRASAEGVRQAEQGVVDTQAEGIRQIQEQRRQLLQTRQDTTGQIDEQRNALKAARDERVQGEREALAELVRISREGNQQIRDQEEALNDTRADGAERVAEAQTAAVEAQRAAAAAARDAADAQKAVREETVKLTPAQKALFDEYKRFQQIGDRTFRGAENAAARLGVPILRLTESYFPLLGRVSEDTIGALTRSFETFRNELAQPVEQAGITRYLALIPDLTETAATAAGRLGLALFNVFSRSLRFALPLTTAVGDIADEFLRWTESARGTRAIDRFFEDSVDMALRLLPAIQDLAVGFGNLVTALDRTGIVDQSVRGFSALAESFAESTRAGGGLDTFLRNARDLMPFVADAAKAVGGAILEIASAAIGARDKGSRLTVLQSIFKGIAESAKPLKDLVIGTFRNLGPVIAELLPELSRFFATFAGSSGPLVAFVDVITRGLRIFNNLPDPVKRTVAQLAALKLILGGLGITAVVAPMGRFASNMLIARGAASRLAGKSALGGVAASIGSLALRGGLIAAAVAGIALLGLGLKRAYDKNQAFRESVNRLGSAAGEVFQGIANKVTNQLLPALSKLADKGANAILDIFDLDTPMKNAIQKDGVFATRQFGLGIRQGGQNQTGEGSPAHEFGFKIGRAIGDGINKWAQGGKGKGGRIDEILRSNSNPVAVGVDLGAGVREGLNKTDWKQAGRRLVRLMGEGATDPTVLNWIEELARKIDKQFHKHSEPRWKAAGQDAIAAFKLGLGFPTFKPLIGPSKAAGVAAKEGFLEGFRGKGDRGGGLGGGIVGAIGDAINAVRNYQKEGSPAKLWIPHGQNAARGYLKGFLDTMKNEGGQIQDAIQGTQVTASGRRTIQAAQGTASGRQVIQAARSVNSPGGKSITAAEMRDIMREAYKAQAKNIYAAAVAAGLDPRVLRLLDSIMAKDFNFRTNMLADAR